MVKLQDFARQQGVTDRQIQRLIKKYEAVLDGMIERKGSNGTWLSEDACDVLRSKMKTQAPDLYDDAKDLKITQLEERIRELEERMERKDVLIEKLQNRVEEKTEQIEKLQGSQLLLEDREKQLNELQEENQRLRNRSLWQRIRNKEA